MPNTQLLSNKDNNYKGNRENTGNRDNSKDNHNNNMDSTASIYKDNTWEDYPGTFDFQFPIEATLIFGVLHQLLVTRDLMGIWWWRSMVKHMSFLMLDIR